jgi:hypothetical protein
MARCRAAACTGPTAITHTPTHTRTHTIVGRTAFTPTIVAINGVRLPLPRAAVLWASMATRPAMAIRARMITLAAQFDEAQDHVAVALTRPAHGAQLTNPAS